MRTAYEGFAIKNEAGEIYAYNLGSDFCAEHEWGISDLLSLLGVDTSKIGLAGRTSTKSETLNKSTVTETHGGIFYLSVDRSYSWRHSDEPARVYFKDHRTLHLYNDSIVGAAWSGEDFGIAVRKSKDPELFKFLKKLEVALREGDVAVWFGGKYPNNPFARPGLVIGIASMVPEDVINLMVASDQDRIDLQETSDKTGIIELLKSKGKKYYACAPKWIGEGEKETKFKVIYWLNPSEQSRHNYGWFTVEELEAWANDVPGNKIAK